MDERLLSGNPAEKVGAAAREAVPGGRILRVEIGSDGSPYEAHVRRSDGTDVTVRVDEDFEVTGIEVGFGSPAARWTSPPDLQRRRMGSGSGRAPSLVPTYTSDPQRRLRWSPEQFGVLARVTGKGRSETR